VRTVVAVRWVHGSTSEAQAVRVSTRNRATPVIADRTYVSQRRSIGVAITSGRQMLANN